MVSMLAASPDSGSGARHILLNAQRDVPDHMTAIVVGVSATAAAGVVAFLRQAGLLGAEVGGRSAVYIEDAKSLARRRSLSRFSAPRLIVISHDPVALVEELGAAEGDPAIGVRRAQRRIELVFRVALRSACPVLVLSHALAIGPLAKLAAVVGPFCGIETPPGGWPRPDAPTQAPATRGYVALRHDGAVPSQGEKEGAARTIVIGGPPRAGTSMIAAVLHAAGLPLGEELVPSTFENTPQNILFKVSSPRTWKSVVNGSWKAALANPRHFRLAWDGFDVPGIKALIADRRRDGPVWGFKRPGIGSFLRLGGLGLLSHPRVILSLRDPVAAAARITRAHDVEAKTALRIARWFALDSLETARVCGAPTLLVSHDKAQSDLPGLVERLLSFCGLAVDAGRYDEIAASVERAGATYRKDFAEPFIGEIMDVVDHEVFGWVEGGLKQPVVVEILADDRRIASGLADRRADDGQLVFVIALPPADVTGTTRIRAIVSSSRAELRNSGATLAELRRG